MRRNEFDSESEPVGDVGPGVVRVFNVLILLIFIATGAHAQSADCDPPEFIAVESDHHFHPALIITYYKRNPDPDSTAHDVVRMVTPPNGLGIEAVKAMATSRVQAAGMSAYRSIHIHGHDGTLYVEPVAGETPTACHLFALWKRRKGDGEAVRDIIESATTHVRIGDRYFRDVSKKDLLRLPLTHNERIIVFVEQKSAI